MYRYIWHDGTHHLEDYLLSRLSPCHARYIHSAFPVLEANGCAEVDISEGNGGELFVPTWANLRLPSALPSIRTIPCRGEGGYVPANKYFLEGLRKICDREGILLIIDEGFPLSGIVTAKHLADKQPAGSQGGTYAGNAVSCAAGVACAQVMREEHILDNVQARSKQLLAGLRELVQSPETSHLIADVRGLGLMIGVEFNSPKPAFGFALPKDANASDNVAIASSERLPPEKLASRVAAKCMESGMLILTTSVYETIRFIPPLNISEQDMARGIKIFQDAVREVARES
ncbi:hypothetical protein EMMF5_000439 [Cystobasidiomycetes sp. EMM_F5]